MGMKLLSLFAAVMLVAACETTPEGSGDSAGEGTAADNGSTSGSGTSGVTSEGMGDSHAMPSITPGSQEDLTKNVGDMVFFDFDKSVLKPAAQATLNKQAEWINRFSTVRVKIEGHCDERGTREYNLALGERRASAVKNYLVARGVNPNRIDTVSYGKERPLDPESNPAAWAQNRRGVTVVVRPAA